MSTKGQFKEQFLFIYLYLKIYLVKSMLRAKLSPTSDHAQTITKARGEVTLKTSVSQNIKFHADKFQSKLWYNLDTMGFWAIWASISDEEFF